MNCESSLCKACGRTLPLNCFSNKQLKKKGQCRCNECIKNGREVVNELTSVASTPIPAVPVVSDELNESIEVGRSDVVENKISSESDNPVVRNSCTTSSSVFPISRILQSPFPVFKNHVTMGQKFLVKSNRFKVDMKCNKLLYTYEVKITNERNEERFPKDVKMNIWKDYRNIIERELNLRNELKLYYNGDKMVYSSIKLRLEDIHCTSVTIDEGNGHNRNFNVKMIDINQIIDLNMIREYGMNMNGIPETEMNVLSNILRDYEKSKYFDIGNGFYDMQSENMKKIGGGCSICSGGFNMGFHISDIGLTLNICPTSSIFINDCKVTDIFKEVTKKSDLKEFRTLNNYELKELQKILNGATIECNHQGYCRRYKIKNISNLNALNTEFADQSGNMIKVNDYFMNTYHIQLQYPRLPLLILQNNCSMPMELCKIQSNQRYIKKLSPSQQSEMIKATAIKPNELKRKIERISNVNNTIYNTINNDLSIKIDTEMIECVAHHLPSSLIHFKNGDKKPDNGSFNLKDMKLYEAATIGSWKIFNGDFRNSRNIKRIICDLIDVGKKMNMILPSDSNVINVDIRDINNIYENIEREVRNNNPDFLIFFIPNEDMELYKHIKLSCDVKNGVLSQVLIPSKALKGGIQYLANIIIKINLKCGGTNYIAKSPGILKNPINEKRTMFIGADVCHAGKNNEMKSIACAVCSIDPNGVKYISEVRYQNRGNEIIEELEEMLIILFKEYLNANGGKLPERIIFQRDGVSESQNITLTSTEIPSTQRAIENVFGKNQGIELTYMIVNKRHHTRFFSDTPSTVDKNKNIISGSVIDNTIIDKNRFQLYLVSQNSFQGTIHPACYTVLYEDRHWDENELSLLIYWECYLFNRCTKCISIPPCVKYADLCAYRHRILSTVRRGDREVTDTTITIHPKLRRRMYFS